MTSHERSPSMVTGNEDTSYFFSSDPPLEPTVAGAGLPDSNDRGVAGIDENNQNGLVFCKGRNENGCPIITVYKPVMTTAFTISVPNNSLGVASDVLTAFTQKAVIGALMYRQTIIMLTTSTSMISAPRDTTNKTPRILWKTIWRDRVKRLAPMLKLPLGSIYDGAGKAGSGRETAKQGNYHSSHVEKKLAVFALYTMLKAYGIRTGRYATAGQIRQLREAIQHEQPGEHAQFDIPISRKYCSLCPVFVQRLGNVSGIKFRFKIQHLVQRLPVPSSTTRTDIQVLGTASEVVNNPVEYHGETFTDAELTENNGLVVETRCEREDDAPTPPPPTSEVVEQFSEGLKSFSFQRTRRMIKRAREPLFKRKPLPPTAEIFTPSTSPQSRAQRSD
ncbi:hypothetical protein SODALDRAFT_347137 [Sodiomyces alkalinus F11]|uniref:Uncharacterized protein n=1 Tax=Sodiomyces alkalinus (strain CBS 110278 / VKM F-3762 / F11) TaxID=1314773 RepID=A0A3N2Q5J1_SODAK|nr:hypothetical protein SODALDRAFT_347137 [Sodiomyces alkalinus F11]ROT42044.1 hypothetical protein SODALDRAFT_347137 [Sodiomyces alkalinus F11]